MDLYTYEMKASFQGGSPDCRLCEPSATPFTNVENLSHIIASCDAYKDIRRRILLQIEIVVRQSANQIDFQCILLNKELLTQFILDCTSLNLPTRVSPSDEVCSRIFQLSRDLCFSILKKRISMLRGKTWRHFGRCKFALEMKSCYCKGRKTEITQRINKWVKWVMSTCYSL